MNYSYIYFFLIFLKKKKKGNKRKDIELKQTVNNIQNSINSYLSNYYR